MTMIEPINMRENRDGEKDREGCEGREREKERGRDKELETASHTLHPFSQLP